MGESVRVLFVNPGTEVGGAEQSLLLLLSGLRGRGVQPTVVLFGRGQFHDRLQALGISTVLLPVAGLLRRASRYRTTAWKVPALLALGVPAAIQLALLSRRLRADILHTNGFKGHLLGGLAGRLSRTPVVWHIRDFPPPGFAGRVFSAVARRLPALVLANSDATAAGMTAEGPLRGRLLRVYNPVDIEKFEPGRSPVAARRALGFDHEGALVGLIAHLTPWKGHELFLDIARKVADVLPDVRFLVVGGEVYGTDGHRGYALGLHARAAELGLTDRVSFLGARDDVPDLLASLDLLVHCPTAPEPFGRVLVEAVAAGRPVVAANCGGIPEIVDDGVTGFLVSPGDIDGFASAVVRLVNDAALRERFARAGRRRVEALCGIEAHATCVLDAYRSLLSENGATGDVR